MNNFNFTVGDKVYYPRKSNKILTATKIKVPIVKAYSVEVDGTSFTSDGKEYLNHTTPSIFPATQEYYELLSKLYPNVEFEPPPKRKNPKEVIQAMLDDGWDTVPVFYLEDGTKCIGYAKRTYAAMSATPFDPKTGKTIIDYVDGEVILGD